ncbi:MAG TPA: M13 family metallopeptidase N-terminal domain-containing protein, partial [Candidatus Solibacter sp.]|nr:M13 family metallopeptidase N-terminal domain-containing protein [Candidatus Solibacter sp.]
MRNHFLLTFGIVLLGLSATAQDRPAPKFDIANIDKSIDPCVDFYQYACSNWMKRNPIPSDYTDWISFSEVEEHNNAVLRGILEKASVNDPKRSPVVQKIGDFYTACMDETAANKKGYAPIKPELDRIAAVKDKTQMIEVVAHESLIGPNPIFAFYSNPDVHNADMTIAFIDQGGIVLPDRDYYLKDDPDMVAIRKTYVEHIASMFKLIGRTPDQARHNAEAVMKIETELARAA